MADEIELYVPLTPAQTMSLLLQAAEVLQHRVLDFQAERGTAVLHVDFSLRALSTFRIQSEARSHAESETHLRLVVRPAFKLALWTGVGQSQRVGWQLVGKMQEILDPTRYRQLEDEVLPSRRPRNLPDRSEPRS